MKLNVGSGTHPTTEEMREWVDVDLIWSGVEPPHGVHGDAFALPFRDDSFDAAYLGHALEHFRREEIPALGAELRRVLRPGVDVVVVGPDMDRVMAFPEFESMAQPVVGVPNPDDPASMEGPGAHKWPPTEAATIEAMKLLGLVDVRPYPMELTLRPHWPNVSPVGWQCCLKGRT